MKQDNLKQDDLTQDDMTQDIAFVRELPDLLTPADQNDAGGDKKIRIRIKTTEQGVEILGDSMYPGELERLMRHFQAHRMEMVLCG